MLCNLGSNNSHGESFADSNNHPRRPDHILPGWFSGIDLICRQQLFVEHRRDDTGNYRQYIRFLYGYRH